MIIIYEDKEIWILGRWENWFLIWGITVLSCLMFESLNFFILTLFYIHCNNSFHFTRSSNKYNMWLLEKLSGGWGCVGVVLWRRGDFNFFRWDAEKKMKTKVKLFAYKNFFQCDNCNRFFLMNSFKKIC